MTYTDFCKTSLFLVFVVPCAAILLYHLFFYILRRAVDKTGRTVTCPIPAAARSQRAHLQHNGAFRSVRSIFLYRGRVYRIRARDAADRAAGAGGRRRVDRAQNPGETKKGSLLAGVLIILAISVTITFVSTVNLDNASNELPEGSYALHVFGS